MYIVAREALHAAHVRPGRSMRPGLDCLQFVIHVSRLKNLT